MVTETVLGTAMFISLLATPSPAVLSPLVYPFGPQVLAEHRLNLTMRLPEAGAAQIFADNILLTLHYLKGDVENPKEIDWEKIREPFMVELTLEPGEVFAYHDALLPEFSDKKVKTTNAHFDYPQGFKSLEGLVGNGVCHLASLINWVASDAGLEVTANVNHDFYPVPGVPQEFGTSIRWDPTGARNSFNQNLYVKNTFDYTVTFEFKANNEAVDLKITR